MGAGRWTCAEALEAWQNGTPIVKGQLIGWVLGFWSAATFVREEAFVDKVEAAGGEAITRATLAECQKAPPETLLYRVSRSMVQNTK